MSGVTGALVVGGVAAVGAGATAYAGHEAANATKNATNASIAAQEKAASDQATLSAPYRQIGTDATSQYEALLGIGDKGSPANIEEALRSTPGYMFAKSQGMTGILNQASLGGGVSGNTLAALDTFNSGLADSTYQQQVGNLAGAVQTGQAAAAGQAQNVGTTAANIGSALINQGNTTAGIDANVAAGLTKSLSSAGNDYIEAKTLAALAA